MTTTVLARVIRKSGHTQAELAAMVNMDVWQFNKKLHGWNGMGFTRHQLAILAAAGVDIATLCPIDPTPEAA